jgi:tripartite-type tricarboxylate transporter receptor subunit TctC
VRRFAFGGMLAFAVFLQRNAARAARRTDMQNLARGARLAALSQASSFLIAATCLGAQISSAQAQGAAAFFKGRNVNMEIGYSAGGGYDVYARMIARFMGKHIPGAPAVIPKNMQGAGSLRLANWIYSAAPKDGTEIGTIGRGIAFDPLLGNKNAQFDAGKFTWLGSATNEVSVCVAWEGSGITKFDDLYTKPLAVGGTGGGADTDVFPQILNAVLGTKMKLISGYPGGNDVGLAMERGEVQGRCGWSWSSVQATHKDWIMQKKIVVLVQLALSKHPDLPDVPLVTDLAKTDEQRQILKLIFARQVMGRPYLAPPGVPKERVDALRQAFLDTMKDKEFLAEADTAQLEINPVTGPAIEKLLQEVYQTPADIAAKAAQVLNPK